MPPRDAVSEGEGLVCRHNVVCRSRSNRRPRSGQVEYAAVFAREQLRNFRPVEAAPVQSRLTMPGDGHAPSMTEQCFEVVNARPQASPGHDDHGFGDDARQFVGLSRLGWRDDGRRVAGSGQRKCLRQRAEHQRQPVSSPLLHGRTAASPRRPRRAVNRVLLPERLDHERREQTGVRRLHASSGWEGCHARVFFSGFFFFFWFGGGEDARPK